MNNYEKKYKEALEKAKDILSNKEVRQEDIEYLFPELKESEDKIYKRAIRQMYSFLPNKPTHIGNVRVEDIFTWLAKQGLNHDDKYNITGIKSKHAEGKLGEMIKEIKSTDKVEPKFHEGDIMRTLEEAKEGITDGLPVVVSIDNEYYHCNNELIAIKDQDNYEYPPMNRRQNPAWSEEDEYCIHQLIVFCENCMVKDDGAKRCAHWLKSLKDRYTWRASWEQLDALEYHLKHTNENSRLYKETKNLYDQLKKL